MNAGAFLYLLYLSGIVKDREKIVYNEKSIEDYRSCLTKYDINPDFERRKIKLTKEQKVCAEDCVLKQLGIIKPEGIWDREKLDALEKGEDGLKGLDGVRDILDTCEGHGKTSCKLVECVYEKFGNKRKERYSYLFDYLLINDK